MTCCASERPIPCRSGFGKGEAPRVRATNIEVEPASIATTIGLTTTSHSKKVGERSFLQSPFLQSTGQWRRNEHARWRRRRRRRSHGTAFDAPEPRHPRAPDQKGNAAADAHLRAPVPSLSL